MKALLSFGFAIVLLTGVVEARPAHRVPGKPHPVMAPLEEAATKCFAETVMANPKAINLAKAGRWYEAAGVIGFLCRPEVDRMAQGHDQLFGRGTGARYFKGAYARHLGKQLEMLIQPLLEPKTVASADAAESAGVVSDARSPARDVTH